MLAADSSHWAHNDRMTVTSPLTHHADAQVHLARDPVLAALIAKHGDLPVRQPSEQPFAALVGSVTGQQLSVKAASSIHNRLLNLLGEVTPVTILNTNEDALRGAGLSWAKVRTLKALAQAAQTGAVDFEHLSGLPDEDIIAALVQLPGIGHWTAEMFLMSALARPDVFSMGDLTLRQSVARLYPEEQPSDVLARWQPYRTLAARYLWHEDNFQKTQRAAQTPRRTAKKQGVQEAVSQEGLE